MKSLWGLAKVASMFILGLGSLGAGMLPAVIPECNRPRFPLTTLLMSCFGAGILLAASLIHILPEVSENASNNTFEYEPVNKNEDVTLNHPKHKGKYVIKTTVHTTVTADNANKVNHGRHQSLHFTETAPLLHSSSLHTHANTDLLRQHYTSTDSSNEHEYHGSNRVRFNDGLIEDDNARNTTHTQPCNQSMTGTFGLFVALSLHSAIGGLGIGVLFLSGAVACHKLVMSFYLGLEFRSNPQSGVETQFIACIVLLSIRRFCVWPPPEEAALLVDGVAPEVDEAAATVVALAKPADEEIA
uniref:Zinc/iron permease n=1 Tax=Glossina pallidipes TaxID=7398 RepID=A0A1A9ZHG4_GLOPL